MFFVNTTDSNRSNQHTYIKTFTTKPGNPSHGLRGLFDAGSSQDQTNENQGSSIDQTNTKKEFKHTDIKFDKKFHNTPHVLQVLFNLQHPSQVKTETEEIKFATNSTTKKCYLNAIIGAMRCIDDKVENVAQSFNFKSARGVEKQAMLANALLDAIDDIIKISGRRDLQSWQVAEELEKGCIYLSNRKLANQLQLDPDFKDNMCMYSNFFLTIKHLAVIRNNPSHEKFQPSDFSGSNKAIEKLQERFQYTFSKYEDQKNWQRFEPLNESGMLMKKFVFVVGVGAFSCAYVAGTLALSAVLSIVFPPALAMVITAGLAVSLYIALGISIKKVIDYRHAVMLDDLIKSKTSTT